MRLILRRTSGDIDLSRRDPAIAGNKYPRENRGSGPAFKNAWLRQKQMFPLFRTGTKPISGEVDLLVFESNQRAAPDFEITAECFGPVEGKADTTPTGHRATELRPVIEKIPGSIPGIDEVPRPE